MTGSEIRICSPCVLQSDIEKIRLTLEEVDRQSFDRAVDAIVSARKIYIMGVRSSASLATFLSFYFNLIFDNVISVAANTASEVFETMLRVGAEDVVIGVSFPRYSSRTVQAMNFARDRGATTIAITDSEASPLAPISTLHTEGPAAIWPPSWTPWWPHSAWSTPCWWR